MNIIGIVVFTGTGIPNNCDILITDIIIMRIILPDQKIRSMDGKR